MFFETAGIEVAPWIPPLVAFVISFFTSMGGVSGAFLLLPFQISCLNYTNPSVSATNQLYNIVAIPSGVYQYWREGRMVWPLTWIIILGTLPGVFMGALIRIMYLPDPKHFKLFAACVLLYIAVKLFNDLIKKKLNIGNGVSSEKHFQQMAKDIHTGNATEENVPPVIRVTHFSWKRLAILFYGESFNIPFLGVFSLSFIIGIVGGIYGIGGGAIIAPLFITFFELPVYIVAGAALMGTFVTSVAGVIFYQIIALFLTEQPVAPDWLLGILFGAGGMAGMYLGARCQKFVSARYIKLMLAIVIIYTCVRYVIDFAATI